MNKMSFDVPDPGRGAMLPAAPQLETPLFEDLSLDLRALWSAVYRNRYIFGIILLLAALAGLIVTMLTTPKYMARTSIQVEEQSARVLGSQEPDLYAAASDEDRFLQTQTDVLNSRTIRQLVSDRLKLAQNDSFFRRMGLQPGGEGSGLAAQRVRRERAVGVIGANLDIKLPRNSRIVDIQFTSPDPVLAADISNAIAQTYITFNLQRKFDTSAYARNFVEARLADVKRRLEESERALIDYARTASLIDASAGSGGGGGDGAAPRSLTTSNLVLLNQAYGQASAARVSAEQRWEQARRTPLMSLPEVLSNSTVQSLTQRRSEAQAAYDQDRQRRKPDFPSMQQAAANIRELDVQVKAAAMNILNSYRDQYETSLKQEEALSARLNQLKGETLAEQSRSVRYTILRRETDTNRTLYDGLLQRYKELSASAGLLSNNISIVDPAAIPGVPISPKLWLNMLIALVGGLVIAGAVVLVREKLEDVIRLPEDVTRKLRVPFLNSVPLLSGNTSPSDALEDVRSPLSEAYYALRTSIELASTNGAPRTILFTSSRQAEGKSTSAAAIAQNFARSGKRVLLIDADLRKPSLHRVLDLPRGDGIANVLARQRTLAEVLTPTGIHNLDFIGCGPLPPSPAELLSGPMLRHLLDSLQDDYDHVILDGPPVLGLADAVLLANVTDAVVFVVQFNSSKGGQVKAAIARLRSGGANILGAVLTKFDIRKTGYGDEYGYVYSYGAERPAG